MVNMKMNYSPALLFVLFVSSLSFTQTVNSEPSSQNLQFLLGINGASGGDTIAFISDSSGAKDRFHAGSGIGLHAGALLKLDKFDLRSTIGFLRSGDSNSNGRVSLIRYPLDIAGHYFFDGYDSKYETIQHGLGGGLVYHLSPSLEVDSKNAATKDTKLDDARGYFFEYVLASRTKQGAFAGGYLGLRYTVMDYQATANNIRTNYKANSLGLNFGLAF